MNKNRKQRAMEERFRPKSYTKKEGLPFAKPMTQKEISKAMEQVNAKQQEKLFFEMNRECTLEDLLKRFDDERTGRVYWEGFDTSQIPNWKNQVSDIIKTANKQARDELTYYLYGFRYSDEFIKLWREKCIAEFKLRKSPLYKML